MLPDLRSQVRLAGYVLVPLACGKLPDFPDSGLGFLSYRHNSWLASRLIYGCQRWKALD